jgi:hypothetical protein
VDKSGMVPVTVITYFQDDLSQYLLNFKINIVLLLQIKKQIAQVIDLITFFW